MANIVLGLVHRRSIAKRGEAAYPLECRGWLLGHLNDSNKQVHELVFSDESTQLESPDNRYLGATLETREGEELARAEGLEILGFVHSFANRPARPSSDDRQRCLPTFSYVIVGIRDGRAHELTAWTLSEDRTAFFQETMSIS